MTATAELMNAASRAAVLTAAQTTKITKPPVDVDTDALVLDPDPWTLPDETGGAGFGVSDKIGVDLRVLFHRNPRGRTIYLLLDASSPLSGSYVFQIDGETASTYTASSESDLAALVTEWAAQINTDYGSGGAVGDFVTATAVDYTDSGAANAVKITALPAAAVPASGTPAGASYSTFAIGASTAAPEAAALHILREVDSASLRILTRAAYTKDTAVDNALTANAGLGALADTWGMYADVGALGTEGYDRPAVPLPARSFAWLHLYSPVTTDATLSIASSGAGIYTISNLVYATIAPVVSP